MVGRTFLMFHYEFRLIAFNRARKEEKVDVPSGIFLDRSGYVFSSLGLLNIWVAAIDGMRGLAAPWAKSSGIDLWRIGALLHFGSRNLIASRVHCYESKVFEKEKC